MQRRGRRPGRSERLATLLWALTGMGIGCGGAPNACPPGMIRQGGTCVPVPDTKPHEIVLLPEVVEEEETLEGGGEPEPLEDGLEASDEGESNEDASAPGGFVGIPCAKDGDCRKTGAPGVCLDWPGGYCTLLDCGGSGEPCPVGSACLGITPNKPACAQVCESVADCREGGEYGCKALSDPDGDLIRVCHPIKKQGGPAEGCSGHQDCAGDASCLTSFAGGYCAVLGCGESRPCPEGTACVIVNGTGTCLKRCAQSDDCLVAGDLPRTCTPLKSALVPGEKEKVCASGTFGVPIGGQCLSDMECASEDCEVVVTGHCSASGAGCRVDGDCPGFGEVCVQAATDTKGYCTKACSLTTPCPGSSFCVGTKTGASGQASGMCVPGCLEPGDLACRAEVGFACIYGDPVSGPGRYVCARILPGQSGSACTTASDCASGSCLLAPGGGGYCVASCGFLGFCPFPTSCQQVSGQSRCLLRCQSSVDCPPGHECTRPVGALLDVCYPK